MKKFFLVTGLLILFTGFFISCKKPKGDPPLLPTSESMVIDFRNFTTNKKSADIDPALKGTESSTWQFAAAIAGVWNSLISSNISIPIAAYGSATNYNPGYVSQNLWQWSYEFTSNGIVYKTVLKGEVSTNIVNWKMYLSNDLSGGFSDFLWLEGTSKTDGSGGQWIFYKSPEIPVKIFQTDWTKSGDVITSVKFTYLISDSNKDSYITFLALSSGDFDYGYNIHFSDGLYSDSDIEWNTITMNGRLKCIDYLQDDSWYCWDTNKINKICD